MMDWRLNSKGTMYLRGEGKTENYLSKNDSKPPWYEVKDRIRKLVVEEGITELGLRSFKDCKYLETVILPATLKRIHAECFWGCEKLKVIQTKQEVVFKFIYDRTGTSNKEMQEKQHIKFGINSFYGTPWALKQWGNYYIADHALMACFSLDRKAIVPEGVLSIEKFAFLDTNLAEIELPESLLSIKTFAFQNTQIKRVMLPKKLQNVEYGAFTGTTIESVVIPPDSEVDIDLKAFKGTNISFAKCGKSHLREAYGLTLHSTGKGKDYKRLLVEEKRYVVGKKMLSSGDSFLRRIKSGSVIIGIKYDKTEKRVLNVKSFIWSHYAECPEEYLMYPCYMHDQAGNPASIWKDSMTYMEEWEIRENFFTYDPERLLDTTLVRCVHEDIGEEWFGSSNRGDFGGPLELRILDDFLKAHPDYRLESFKENMEASKCRIFVEC